MSLGIRKHQLEFDILDTGNIKTLVFADGSSYYGQPDRPLLQVTLPGYNKYFVVNVVAGKINTFNSNTIGMTETLGSSDLADLPDGVWTLNYMICPYDKIYLQKYHLRTTTLESKLDMVYNDYDLSDCSVQEDEKIKADLVDIMLGIASGKANARQGYVKKASEIYQRIDKKVTDLLNRLSGICHAQSAAHLHTKLDKQW